MTGGEFDGVLDGKAALITGANQGLGLEIARHYLDAGASVFICARNAELLADAAGELAERGGEERVGSMVADVADPAQVDALVATAVERFPQLSILVNNAGVYGPKGPIETSTGSSGRRRSRSTSSARSCRRGR